MFKTLINEFDSGVEQRRKLLRFSKRTFSLSYKYKTRAARDVIHDFYRLMAGAYEAFWFVDLQDRKWVDEYVARGNGSTVTFDIHSKSTISTSLKIYIDGVEKIKDTDWTFVSGGGGAGADRVTFGSAPSSGALITSDIGSGYLRIKGRFNTDSFKEEVPVKGLITFSVDIAEVQW
jgi:hypothetical protein